MQAHYRREPVPDHDAIAAFRVQGFQDAPREALMGLAVADVRRDEDPPEVGSDAAFFDDRFHKAALRGERVEKGGELSAYLVFAKALFRLLSHLRPIPYRADHRGGDRSSFS
jgi:hypothetical protein